MHEVSHVTPTFELSNLRFIWSHPNQVEPKCVSLQYAVHNHVRSHSNTWEQVGDPWCGHTSAIVALAVNSTGTLLASASSAAEVRFGPVLCTIFSNPEPDLWSGSGHMANPGPDR